MGPWQLLSPQKSSVAEMRCTARRACLSMPVPALTARGVTTKVWRLGSRRKYVTGDSPNPRGAATTSLSEGRRKARLHPLGRERATLAQSGTGGARLAPSSAERRLLKTAPIAAQRQVKRSARALHTWARKAPRLHLFWWKVQATAPRTPRCPHAPRRGVASRAGRW